MSAATSCLLSWLVLAWTKIGSVALNLAGSIGFVGVWWPRSVQNFCRKCKSGFYHCCEQLHLGPLHWIGLAVGMVVILYVAVIATLMCMLTALRPERAEAPHEVSGSSPHQDRRAPRTPTECPAATSKPFSCGQKNICHHVQSSHAAPSFFTTAQLALQRALWVACSPVTVPLRILQTFHGLFCHALSHVFTKRRVETVPDEACQQCYICQQGHLPAPHGRVSETYCRCGSRGLPVHPHCAATWQYQQKDYPRGSFQRMQETHCRFCNEELPDWRKVLRPPTITLNVFAQGVCRVVTIANRRNAVKQFKYDMEARFDTRMHGGQIWVQPHGSGLRGLCPLAELQRSSADCFAHSCGADSRDHHAELVVACLDCIINPIRGRILSLGLMKGI